MGCGLLTALHTQTCLAASSGAMWGLSPSHQALLLCPGTSRYPCALCARGCRDSHVPSGPRDLGTGQSVRGWPAPGPARCLLSEVMAAADTVLCRGQAFRCSCLQNRARAPARISHAPGAFTCSQADLGRLHRQGPAPGAPRFHACVALPPTARKRLLERAAEQGCRPAAHGARVKGGSPRFPAFSRVFTVTTPYICDQKKQYLNYIHESRQLREQANIQTHTHPMPNADTC